MQAKNVVCFHKLIRTLNIVSNILDTLDDVDLDIL